MAKTTKTVRSPRSNKPLSIEEVSVQSKPSAATRRRDFLKVAALGAAAGLSTGVTASSASPRESEFDARDIQIIDFRCRPPIPAYKVLFDVTRARAAEANRKNIAPANFQSPSVFKAGQDVAIDLLLRELNSAHVDKIVMPGRNVSDISTVGAVAATTEQTSFNVTDQMLVDLNKRLKNRTYGLHGIDLTKPIDEIVADITKGVREFGLKGAVMEPGYAKGSDGAPLSLAEKKLFPISETMIGLNAVLMVQSGIYAGPDISVNDWGPLDRVMQQFPKLKAVLAHGGYPRVIDAMSLCTKHDNFYISPDIYSFFPAGELYVNAINKLPDQFIYASAYPLGDIKVSVDESLKFPLERSVMERYMGGNAARLLGVS
jgi:predicted TIM-barrel fold metal-dependent hydrolase